MKIFIQLLLLVMSININNVYSSGFEVKLPHELQNDKFLEGTQVSLSPEQIREILPWAKDTKFTLDSLLQTLQFQSNEKAIEGLLIGINKAVSESVPGNTELLMRYVLNRGLVVYQILDEETSDNAPGIELRKAWILKETVRMALDYYKKDELYLESGNTNRKIDFAEFAYEYFEFLHELNLSIFDASAQFRIERFALGVFHWDLYRNIENDELNYSIIKHVHIHLETLIPKKAASDREAVSLIRDLKRLELNINLEEGKRRAKLKTKENVIMIDGHLLKPDDTIYVVGWERGGRLKGFNFAKNIARFHPSGYVSTAIRTINIDDIMIPRGCFYPEKEQLCVGDTIYPDSYDRSAVIIAIHKKKKLLKIRPQNYIFTKLKNISADDASY